MNDSLCFAVFVDGAGGDIPLLVSVVQARLDKKYFERVSWGTR